MKLISILKYLKASAAKFDRDRRAISIATNGETFKIADPILEITGPERMKIGKGSYIGKNAWLACYVKFLDKNYTPELNIGDKVTIGNYACITLIEKISIGDGCLFSDYVYISDHTHGFDPACGQTPAEQTLVFKGSVIVGTNCFLGMRVTIMPGVELGHNCIVGAHSVVTRSFPPHSMIAGAPAKLIKRYSIESGQWENVD